MGYKIKYVIKKSRLVFIITAVLWVVLSIVLIMPGTLGVVDSTADGKLNVSSFIDSFSSRMGNVSGNFGNVFKPQYRDTFLKGELYLTIVLFLMSLIGFIKMLPKNEYTDIEHGSSDWSEHGEQYKILNANKGILLAEKNYLPVDKRGNTNVLVVGRFWFW